MNNKVMEIVETKLAPFANKLASQRHLKCVQSAFLSCMPFMIIGSFALIFWEPPVDYTTLETTNIFYGFFKGWSAFATFAGPFLELVFTITLGSLSFYVAVGIAYFLSKSYALKAFIPVVVTIANFLMLNSSLIDGGFSNAFFDGTGLFAAILVGVVTTEIFRFLIEKKVGSIKMPDGVPPALAGSFEALVPVTIMILLTGMLSVAILNLTGTTLPSIVLTIISPLIKFVDNVFGVSLIAVLQQVLWWFGIHDTAIGAVISPIRDANIAMNSAAYAAGTAVADLPYTFTAPFWWVFCQIGGSGCTLGLAVLLLKSKSKQLKTVGKLGIIPALFNINEPIQYGAPLVFNPLLAIPFVIANMVNAGIVWASMYFGFCNKAAIMVSANIPMPIFQYLVTLDWRSIIVFLVMAVVSYLVFKPFVSAYDKECLKEQKEMKEANA